MIARENVFLIKKSYLIKKIWQKLNHIFLAYDSAMQLMWWFWCKIISYDDTIYFFNV